ncbi:MAG: serine/threonine protein kinase [Pyrinomonadaceae bacterium]
MLTNGRELDNRYLIREEIGSGGFGAVYLAEDTRFSGNNRVAIKKILQTNEFTAKAFHNEANLLYNLSHPNLPKVTNCFQEENANFIVMDFITGEDLMQKLKKGTRFTVEEVLTIADKVLDALEYLHSFLIYHRDIKPHNIKIDEAGKIFLLDFGTAKGQLDEKTVPITDQSITGYTPFYAPLEQVLRVDANSYLLLQSIDTPFLEKFLLHKTDARSDIYSLGATIYHLLTGYSPEKATVTIRTHLIWSGKPDSLPDSRTFNPEISERLSEIIKKCLEIEPENRFQTATELRTAFKNLQFANAESKKQPENSVPHQILETQISQPQTILEQPKNLPVAQPSIAPLSSSEIIFKDNKPPKSSGKFIVLIAGGLILFAALAAFGGWLVWKNLIVAPEKSETANRPETIPQPVAGKLRTLSYALLVQKMRDGKKFQEPFESSGQEIFENGYQFQMNFTIPDAGYLYAFAEGFDENGEKILTIAFPTPLKNNGNANISANQKYETGWNEFGGKAGTEKFWIVWNKDKSEIVENSRENAFKNNGKITDDNLRNKLKDYLEEGQSDKAKISKNVEKKLTKVDFEGDSIVYLIQLEHR